MVRALSDREKKLINVRLNWIKENNSFTGKVFFTIVSIAVGGLYLLFQKQISWTEPLTKLIVGAIIFGFILFNIRIIFSLSNIRFSYDELMDKIISSRTLSGYKLKRTSGLTKCFDAFQIAYFFFILIILFSSNLTISLIGGILFWIVFCLIFWKRYH